MKVFNDPLNFAAFLILKFSANLFKIAMPFAFRSDNSAWKKMTVPTAEDCLQKSADP